MIGGSAIGLANTFIDIINNNATKLFFMRAGFCDSIPKVLNLFIEINYMCNCSTEMVGGDGIYSVFQCFSVSVLQCFSTPSPRLRCARCFSVLGYGGPFDKLRTGSGTGINKF